jgi:hypothetical protein
MNLRASFCECEAKGREHLSYAMSINTLSNKNVT